MSSHLLKILYIIYFIIILSKFDEMLCIFSLKDYIYIDSLHFDFKCLTHTHTHTHTHTAYYNNC